MTTARAEKVEVSKERIADLDLVAEFEATGADYAELDHEGNAVIVRPSRSAGASPTAARAGRAASGVVRQGKPAASKSAKAVTKGTNAKGGTAKAKVARTQKSVRAR